MDVINTDVFVNTIKITRQLQVQQPSDNCSLLPEVLKEEKEKYFKGLAWRLVKTMTEEMKQENVLEYRRLFRVEPARWYYTLVKEDNQPVFLKAIRERLVGDAKIEVGFIYDHLFSSNEGVVDCFYLTFKA